MSVAGQMLLTEAAKKAPRSTVEAAARVLQVGEQPAQATFIARALNALAHLTTEMDERSLGDAAGAPSDYAVLLRALEHPEALAVLRQQDPLAPARLRGLREREKLLQAEGGAVGVDEAAALLGISRQAVDKRRRAGKLIGLTLGRRGYVYPVWQFSQGGTLPGLEEVLTELRGHDPWMQVIFMLSENTRLGGLAPLHELRHGHVDDVRRAARMLGEHGAV